MGGVLVGDGTGVGVGDDETGVGVGGDETGVGVGDVRGVRVGDGTGVGVGGDGTGVCKREKFCTDEVEGVGNGSECPDDIPGSGPVYK